MKAVYIEQFGGSEKIKFGDLPKPTLTKGEVLIHLSHTSVNPVDWKIREGYLQGMLPHQFPLIPGWDAAGTIEAVAPDVKDFKVGDAVYAYARKETVQHGTYAEYVTLPTSFVAKKPEAISAAEAAAIPLTGLTAWQGIHDVLKVRTGETVFVSAGAGGVGSFAIQFAKLAGATVITTTSEKNRGYVQELGADHTIDYTKENVLNAIRKIAPNGVDAVFDGAGGTALADGFAALRQNGRIVSIVDTPNKDAAKRPDVAAAYHFVHPAGDQLKQIAALIDRKKVKIPAVAIGSIRDAAHYLDQSRAGHTRGKQVLTLQF